MTIFTAEKKYYIDRNPNTKKRQRYKIYDDLVNHVRVYNQNLSNWYNKRINNLLIVSQ